ncbi:MAG: hypothetical protein EOP67_38505, partial [Sphingomonas sp.]
MSHRTRNCPGHTALRPIDRNNGRRPVIVRSKILPARYPPRRASVQRRHLDGLALGGRVGRVRLGCLFGLGLADFLARFLLA